MAQLGKHFMIMRGSIFRYCTWKRKEIERINVLLPLPLIHCHYPGQTMSCPIPWAHKCAYSNKLEGCFLLFSTTHVPMGPYTVLKGKMPWKAHTKEL